MKRIKTIAQPAGAPTLMAADPSTLSVGDTFVVAHWREVADGRLIAQAIMTLVVQSTNGITLVAIFTVGHPLKSAMVVIDVAKLQNDMNNGTMVAKSTDFWSWQEACAARKANSA